LAGFAVEQQSTSVFGRVWPRYQEPLNRACVVSDGFSESSRVAY
jgi:hypothetical protein